MQGVTFWAPRKISDLFFPISLINSILMWATFISHSVFYPINQGLVKYILTRNPLRGFRVKTLAGRVFLPFNSKFGSLETLQFRMQPGATLVPDGPSQIARKIRFALSLQSAYEFLKSAALLVG